MSWSAKVAIYVSWLVIKKGRPYLYLYNSLAPLPHPCCTLLTRDGRRTHAGAAHSCSKAGRRGRTPRSAAPLLTRDGRRTRQG